MARWLKRVGSRCSDCSFARVLPAWLRGDIARKLTVPHNTMSSHLAVLARARLISSRKDGRSVIYAVNLEGTRELLAFLIEDCCRGKPHLCASLIESTLVECCQP